VCVIYDFGIEDFLGWILRYLVHMLMENVRLFILFIYTTQQRTRLHMLHYYVHYEKIESMMMNKINLKKNRSRNQKPKTRKFKIPNLEGNL
jgi:hypothetical protein